MTCEGFDRWLDDGRAAVEVEAAEAHASSCPRCRAALAAALELERALASEHETVAAPAGFTQRVMARVSAARAARNAGGAWFPALDAMPWWVRACAEPAVLLAAVLTGLVAWRPESVLGLGVAAAEGLAARLGLGATAFQEFLGLQAPVVDPNVRLALWITAAPLVLLASLSLYRWSERLAVRTRPRGAA